MYNLKFYTIWAVNWHYDVWLCGE